MKKHLNISLSDIDESLAKYDVLTSSITTPPTPSSTSSSTSSTSTSNSGQYYNYMYMYSVKLACLDRRMRCLIRTLPAGLPWQLSQQSICLEYRVSWVRIPPETTLIFIFPLPQVSFFLSFFLSFYISCNIMYSVFCIL